MAAIGTLSLGVFLGYMAWYFATRVTDKWIDSFAAVAGILFGGVVLAFIGGAAEQTRWFYPIGLVIGWLIYFALRWLMGKGIPTLHDGPDVAQVPPIKGLFDRRGVAADAAEQAEMQEAGLEARELRNRE